MTFVFFSRFSDFSRNMLYTNFSHLVMSDSLRPHGLQHARLPCPSSTPGACSNYQVSDAIQPSHPLDRGCPFPPAFNVLQYQGLFQ